jgi:hypothetical protein
VATDLSELIPSLKREVSTPGNEETTFPDADDDSWLGYLSDAFWSARLDGMLAGYTAADGIVTPDIDGELQQLVILYAGMAIIRVELLRMQTKFRSKAGPVEYEVEQAATVLKGILDDMTARKALVLQRLSDVGAATDTYYIDALTQMDLQVNDMYWPR